MTPSTEQDPSHTPWHALQRAMAEARQQGAANATVTVDQPSNSLILLDDRNGDVPHIQDFPVTLVGLSGDQWNILERMRNHPTPPGLDTNLVSNFKGHRHEEKLTALTDGLLIQDTTPDGNYRISITRHRRHFITVINHDGASHTVPAYYTHHAINETERKEPGSPVTHSSTSIIAEVLNPEETTRVEIQNVVAITKTAAKLCADYIQERESRSEGLIWPNLFLREFVSVNDPQKRDMPPEPSVSEHHTWTEGGVKKYTTCLTPENAVQCDYDSVQASMLSRAMTLHAPRKFVPVISKDKTIPSVRLLKAEVESLDGTVTQYPVHLWDMEGRSGRYDNQPVPKGEQRLPHSRIGKVRNVSLTMEINHEPNRDSQEFTFDTDIYADQDNRHHLLLIKEGADIPLKTLEDIAYLHSPRFDHPGLPEEVRKAAEESSDEWYMAYLIGALSHGPTQAARELLNKVANAVQAMDLANSQTGTQQTIEARSEDGSIRVILNPGMEQGFHLPDPPVGFVRVDPNTLADAPALMVPTEENPGAIQPGLALRYGTYDGKLESFQPDGTDVFKTVHPLTVRPAESAALDTIRAQPDARWVVVGRGSRHLVLAAMP